MATKSLLVLASCMLCYCTYAQLKGTTFKDALTEKKSSLVYLHNGVADFARMESDNEVHGILIDLMREFETYLRDQYEIALTVDYQQVNEDDFDQFLNLMKTSSGGVFGLSNTSITQKRKKTFKFSRPYLDNISILITNRNVATLPSIELIDEEFGGMTAYSVPSSTYLSRLLEIKENHHPTMKIELLSSGAEVIQKVAEDQQAFAIVDLLYYLEFFKKGYPVKRHKVADLDNDEFGIMMPFDSDWKPVLDQFLSDFIGTSKFRLIVSNHLGPSVIRLISDRESNDD